MVTSIKSWHPWNEWSCLKVVVHVPRQTRSLTHSCAVERLSPAINWTASQTKSLWGTTVDTPTSAARRTWQQIFHERQLCYETRLRHQNLRWLVPLWPFTRVGQIESEVHRENEQNYERYLVCTQLFDSFLLELHTRQDFVMKSVQHIFRLNKFQQQIQHIACQCHLLTVNTSSWTNSHLSKAVPRLNCSFQVLRPRKHTTQRDESILVFNHLTCLGCEIKL